MQGQIQIYTGEGKGKTTAALGLCIRAAGVGLKVAFIQFDKGSGEEDYYSERNILRNLPQVDLQVTGRMRMVPDGKFRFANSPPDLAEAKRGLALASKAVTSGKYDLVICDEILSCILTQLLTEKDVLNLMNKFEESGRKSELVLTGRSLPESVKGRADLVTEMKMVKHYFNKGLPARKGIEF